jgi:hypothetical protein
MIHPPLGTICFGWGVYAERNLIICPLRSSITKRSWLYTRLEAKAVCERAGSAWPIGQEFILSTHSQIVDWDTLDGVLESTLLPNAGSVLDMRAGHSGLRSCSSPEVCWLFAMIERVPRDSRRWPKTEHEPNLRAIRKEGVSYTLEASSV